MTAITPTTQLSVFTLVRAAILANSTLAARFPSNDIYQFEPKHKSSSFRGFPYVLINIPESESTKLVFDNSTVPKEFNANIFLRIEYGDRNNFRAYANAMIKAMEDYESTFQSSGYYDVMIDMIDVDSNQIIEQKEIVEGVF